MSSPCRGGNAPIVGIIPTANDGGHWLVAATVGIFSFGDAKLSGSMGATHLNMPVVGGTAPASAGCSGAQGVAGPEGAPGSQGAAGNTILSGTTIPTSSVGAAGDFWRDTAAEVLYGRKAASSARLSAGTSVVVPQGQKGPEYAIAGQWVSNRADIVIELSENEHVVDSNLASSGWEFTCDKPGTLSTGITYCAVCAQVG